MTVTETGRTLRDPPHATKVSRGLLSGERPRGTRRTALLQPSLLLEARHVSLLNIAFTSTFLNHDLR
jgi:hypothetical protein